MPWFRVDDPLAFHAKVVAAGNPAMGLWVRAGTWCAQQLTDGFVPAHMVRALGNVGQARSLVTAGLWEVEEGGYRFHDWLHYQPSADEVRADQASKHEAKARAGRAGGIASGVARRKHEPSSDEANGKQTESKTKPRPVPTRPIEPSALPSLSHQGRATARRGPGRFVGGEWVNTPRMCPVHQDQALSDLGACSGCTADRLAGDGAA